MGWCAAMDNRRPFVELREEAIEYLNKIKSPTVEITFEDTEVKSVKQIV